MLLFGDESFKKRGIQIKKEYAILYASAVLAIKRFHSNVSLKFENLDLGRLSTIRRNHVFPNKIVFSPEVVRGSSSNGRAPGLNFSKHHQADWQQ